MITLYAGPGQATQTNPANFSLLKKYMCYKCAHLAMPNPMIDTLKDRIICGPCQDIDTPLIYKELIEED